MLSHATVPHAVDGRQAPSMVRLVDEDRLPVLRSTYLHDGRRDEEFRLHSVEHCPGRWLSAKLDAVRGVVASDGTFHLSAAQAVVWIQQLAVIFACLERGVGKSDLGELYIRRFALKFVRPVRTASDIGLLLSIRSRKETGGATFVLLDFSADHNAMSGELTAAIPHAAAGAPAAP